MATRARWRLLLANVAVLAACAGHGRAAPDAEVTPPDAPPAALCTGGYHVCGGFLRDLDGRAVILRGANIANANKSAPYLSFQQAADFARMRDDWGFNAVRFVMPWAAVEPSQGMYDDSYLDQVAMRMKWAADAGLLVVIDMHQDVYGEGFASGGGDGAPKWTCDQAEYDAFVPASSWFENYANQHVINCFDHLWSDKTTRAAFAAAWRHVATRLVGSPAIVGFDVMNEPFWGSYSEADFEANVLEPFYTQVVTQVRDAAPGWVAFLEPAVSRNIGFPTSLTPFPFPDVVYAPHAYDAQAEQGNGFSADRRQPFLDNIAALADEARSLHAALWIGEYGGYGTGLEAYMDANYDGAAKAAAGNMLWSYDRGGNYSILNADGTENATLMAAVVRPYPMRVAGDPVSWQYDDTSGAFSLTFHPDARISAPTVISLPPRLYPNGAQVDCGGCTVAIKPGMAELSGVKPAASVTVTVTPR